MIISFTNMIPESCLEDFSRGVWVETRPLTTLSASFPSSRLTEGSILKRPHFLEMLASMPPTVMVGDGNRNQTWPLIHMQGQEGMA